MIKNKVMKSYTDLEQSKKLAEILPIESADMFYREVSFSFYKVEAEIPRGWYGLPPKGYYCWSLSALFDILPDSTDIVKDKADTENEKYMCTVGVKYDIISTFGNNPVDACVEMIIKLKEQKLL